MVFRSVEFQFGSGVTEEIPTPRHTFARTAARSHECPKPSDLVCARPRYQLGHVRKASKHGQRRAPSTTQRAVSVLSDTPLRKDVLYPILDRLHIPRPK